MSIYLENISDQQLNILVGMRINSQDSDRNSVLTSWQELIETEMRERTSKRKYFLIDYVFSLFDISIAKYIYGKCSYGILRNPEGTSFLMVTANQNTDDEFYTIKEYGIDENSGRDDISVEFCQEFILEGIVDINTRIMTYGLCKKNFDVGINDEHIHIAYEQTPCKTLRLFDGQNAYDYNLIIKAFEYIRQIYSPYYELLTFSSLFFQSQEVI